MDVNVLCVLTVAAPVLSGWSRLCQGDHVKHQMTSAYQCGLTHDGDTPAFLACYILYGLPHIFNVVGVEFSSQSLLMSLRLMLTLSLALEIPLEFPCHLTERLHF